MKSSARSGFIGGVFGAVVLTALLFGLQAAGVIPSAPFLATFQNVVGPVEPRLDMMIPTILFVFAGGLWGALFSVAFANPTILKGMLFGIAPSLFAGLVLDPINGNTPFKGFTPIGIFMPLLFNCLIWGSILGWYCQHHLEPQRGTLTPPSRA